MIPLADRPRFDLDVARALAWQLYRLDGTAEALPSERDENFLLATTAASAIPTTEPVAFGSPTALGSGCRPSVMTDSRGPRS